jgi:hypothetical protein
MKFWTRIICLLLASFIIILSCKRSASDMRLPDEQSVASASKGAKLNTLTLSCVSSTAASITIRVCAGASGAPAGFSVQWMLKSEYDANGWPANSDLPGAERPSFCKASFSGVPGASSYNLAPNGCSDVTLGDVLYDNVGASSTCANTPLQCSSDYVFRAFAHNTPSGNPKSDFSSTITCSTLTCVSSGGCTFTQGYWKFHGPAGCVTGNNFNQWPVTTLTLGSVSYTDLEMCSIFNTPSGGNGLISLAHNLMAAKLNIANGADGSSVAGAIAAADALIGGLVIPPVGAGSLPFSATSALTSTLISFNEGTIGPGHCQ